MVRSLLLRQFAHSAVLFQKPPTLCKISLHQVPPAISESEICSAFSRFGPVIDTQLLRRPDGSLTGSVFMEREHEAQLAVTNLQQRYLSSRLTARRSYQPQLASHVADPPPETRTAPSRTILGLLCCSGG